MNILSQISPQWLTVKEYADKYRVSPLTVYRLVNANKITHKRLGGAIRVCDDQPIPLSAREVEKRRAIV